MISSHVFWWCHICLLDTPVAIQMWFIAILVNLMCNAVICRTPPWRHDLLQIKLCVILRSVFMQSHHIFWTLHLLCRCLEQPQPMKWQRSSVISYSSAVMYHVSWSVKSEDGHPISQQVTTCYETKCHVNCPPPPRKNMHMPDKWNKCVVPILQ